MAIADVLAAASLPIPIFNGRNTIDAKQLAYGASASNSNGQTTARLINTYDAGTLAGTETAQSLVVGQKPFLITHAMGTTIMKTEGHYYCRTGGGSGGTISLVFPGSADAYPGMKITVSDSDANAATHNVTLNFGAGTTIQTPAVITTWSVSTVLSVNAFSVTYVFNPFGTGNGTSTATWDLISAIGY